MSPLGAVCQLVRGKRGTTVIVLILSIKKMPKLFLMPTRAIHTNLMARTKTVELVKAYHLGNRQEAQTTIHPLKHLLAHPPAFI
jgi:hypothetical protein